MQVKEMLFIPHWDYKTRRPVIDQFIVLADGKKGFFRNGLPHRVDGPALLDDNGSEFWLQYGRRHRIGGPAMVYKDGFQAWYQYGVPHRLDGPAVIHPAGWEIYFVCGIPMSRSVFYQLSALWNLLGLLFKKKVVF